MATDIFQATIKAIQINHSKHFSGFDKSCNRLARIAVWAITDDERRVWLFTIEGGLDSTDIEIKTAMFQEFFKNLINHQISFEEKDGTFFAKRESLPSGTVFNYKAIKLQMSDWIKLNFGEYLLKKNQEKASRAKITRQHKLAMNEWHLKKRLELAIWLTFTRGINPKHNNEQWQTRDKGKLYILERCNAYSVSEKKVPVEIVKELLAGKIFLVKRIK
ncbi:MAG: hypothetical protein WCG01_04820 [bacterium]